MLAYAENLTLQTQVESETSREKSKDELSELWRPPQEGYCYQHGNDWSRCAGDHLLYPPRTEKELRRFFENNLRKIKEKHEKN